MIMAEVGVAYAVRQAFSASHIAPLLLSLADGPPGSPPGGPVLFPYGVGVTHHGAGIQYGWATDCPSADSTVMVWTSAPHPAATKTIG